MEKYHAGLFLYHSFLFLLIYINITVQCIFGDSEIILQLISDLVIGKHLHHLRTE